MTLDNLVVLNETLQIPKSAASMSLCHSFLKPKPPSRNRKKLDQNVVIYPIHIQQRLIWSFTQIKKWAKYTAWPFCNQTFWGAKLLGNNEPKVVLPTKHCRLRFKEQRLSSNFLLRDMKMNCFLNRYSCEVDMQRCFYCWLYLAGVRLGAIGQFLFRCHFQNKAVTAIGSSTMYNTCYSICISNVW